jgi:D-aminoacyl-tRNA deacylase
MRALVQRVAQARVDVAGEVVGQTGPGVLVLICAMQGDTPAQADALAAKIHKLRIFRDDAGKMNLALKDTGGSALVVSQFTLAADTRSGNRPGFSTAAAPDLGEKLYLHFAPPCAIWACLSRRGVLARIWPCIWSMTGL